MKQKTKIFFALWVLLLILPMVWVVRINPHLDLWFNTFFAPEWMHILAHFLLFLIVGFLTPWVLFDKTPFKTALLKTIAVSAIIGITQEIFQLMVKQRAAGRNELFDLLIDVFASIIGFFMYWLIFRIITHRENQ